MEEIWKRIPDYEDLYMVSNFGRIYSIGYRKILRGEYIDGYKFVKLKRNRKTQKIAVHRIVASVFIPNPENKPYVNHIDGVKDHNTSDNLEWVTKAENTQHAIKIGLRPSYVHIGKGMYSPNSKIVLQSTLDGQPIKIWYGTSEASRELGINQSSIAYDCRDNAIYKGYIWKYLYDGKSIGQLRSQNTSGVSFPLSQEST